MAFDFTKVDVLTDPNEQVKLLQFFESLRSSPDGWKICIDNLNKGSVSESHHHMRFLCYQVIEDYLKTKYSLASDDDQLLIKEFLRQSLLQILNEAIESPVFLKNKLAQLFSLVFIVDFPTRWRTFMQEVFLANLTNDRITEFYCRLLMVIDTDVADPEIQRTKQECSRNTVIKDSMREYCIADMAQSWNAILERTLTKNLKIISLCLNVIGAYVAWIDLELIANERFVGLIIQSLLNSETEEAAADCVCSILSKGMEPLPKLMLVDKFNKVLQQSGFLRFDKERSSEDCALAAAVLNCIGTVLLECWAKFKKQDHRNGMRYSLEALETKMPDILSCLRHPDSEISGCIIEFAHGMITLLKQVTPLNENQKAFVKELLLATLQRFRYPDDYNHDREGEDEANFQELRKELKVLFTNIGMLESDLTVTTAEEVIRKTFANWQLISVNDLELAITVLYFLGETISSVNQGNLFASTDPKATILKNLVELLIVSGLSNHGHVAINLQYFETVCRYEKVFLMQPGLLPDTTASFLDKRGLHHPSGKVRSRVAYLFSRFVKAQKTFLHQYVEQILYQLQDLLAVVPNEDNADRLISAEDQLFLFETTGTLIVSGNFSSEQKRNYMRALLGNLVGRFGEGLVMLRVSYDENRRKLIYEYLNCIMAYASRTTKAFSNQITMKSCSCDDIFVELMQTFLTAMEQAHGLLLSGLRQYLHRMVICLETELLPHFPTIVSKFVLISQDTKSLQDFLTLLQQAVAKFKADLIPYMTTTVVQLWNAVWTAMSVVVDASDEVATRDLQYLRRAYFQLLSVALHNKTLDLFTVGGDEVRERLLFTISEGALNAADLTVQKQCFSIMHKFAEMVKQIRQHEPYFNQFVMCRALQTCLLAPTATGFDFTDAQCNVILGEIALCLKRFHELQPAAILQRIQEIWPATGLRDVYCNTLCYALTSNDVKEFQKFLKQFYRSILSAEAAPLATLSS